MCWQIRLVMLSVPFAFIFALALTNALLPSIPWALVAPVFAIAYSGLAADLVRRTENNNLAAAIGVSISLFVAFSFMFCVAAEPAALTAFLGLIAGGLMVMTGIALGNRTAIIAGILTALASLAFGAHSLISLVLASSWIELAVFGACAITLGSILDRHGVAINLRLAAWYGAIGERKEEIALDS